ncbi:MAG: SpoIIE family protein phosphatase [Aquihabitans sp.]
MAELSVPVVAHLPPEVMPGLDQVAIQHILLVEDDDGDALLVDALLFEAFGDSVQVVRTSTLAQTKHWLNANVRPARWCALIDLGLPDARGFEVLDALREDAPFDPIVVLTGRADDAQALAAVARGAQDYLVKGRVDSEGLRRSIGYAVERCRADEGSRLLLREQLLNDENVRLERGLLPSPILEQHPELVWAAKYRPGSNGRSLGGDFYDLVETNGIVHLLVGDVCGHGPDEAALGVVMRVAWRALTRAGLSPTEVFEQLNDLMRVEAVLPAQFTTAMSIRLLGSGRVGIVLAGHPPPLVASDEGARCLEVDPGPPLGVQRNARWRETTVEAGSDDWLVGYTDGVIEVRTEPGSTHRLGADAFLGIVDGLWADGSRGVDLLHNLVAEVESRHGDSIDDDIALIAVDLATVVVSGQS